MVEVHRSGDFGVDRGIRRGRHVFVPPEVQRDGGAEDSKQQAFCGFRQ